MRKLIVWNLVTLDGYFEGKQKWELDWHNVVWDPELEKFSDDQSQSVGTLIFGRATYEGMASYWSNATGKTAEFMNAVPKIVCSRSLSRAEWNNTTIISDRVPDAIGELKKQKGKDLYIFGSGNLCSSLFEAGLIDEVRLGLTPTVFGGGTPLFAPSNGGLKMTLLESRPFKSGCVILRYKPDYT